MPDEGKNTEAADFAIRCFSVIAGSIALTFLIGFGGYLIYAYRDRLPF